MDYSNYYLKNYFKNRNDMESERSGDSNAYAQEPVRPAEYYNEAYDVEIEVVPQLIGTVNTNYELTQDDTIVDVIPQNYDRRDAKRRGWIVSLAIITCLLLSVVIGDFMTNGALLSAVSSLYRSQAVPKTSYYALILKENESYSSAKIYGDQLRLLGGAGYIVKDGDNYLVVGDIYDDLEEANAVVVKNEGSRLVSFTADEVDFSVIFADNSQLMQSMGGYSIGVISQLAKIGDSLSAQQIDKATAVDQIESLVQTLQVRFDELSVEDDGSRNVKTLLSDINVTLGLLTNLCDNDASRPNLICDIRYTKVTLALNYCALKWER